MLYRASMNYPTPGGASAETMAVRVSIHDGRRTGLPGWESCGFELMIHRSSLTDWDDDGEMASNRHETVTFQCHAHPLGEGLNENDRRSSCPWPLWTMFSRAPSESV